MITIKTWRDPYDCGFSPTKPTKIELEPGITVLVGCNGAGKTTLLHNIKEVAKKEGIPCHMYNNLHDGGCNALSSAFFYGDTDLGAGLFSSSEGEAIKINFGQIAKKFRRFLQDGFFDSRSNRLEEYFRKHSDEATEEKELCNKRVLLFDAIDSGLSVDSVVEIKNVFGLILEDAAKLGVEVYIVVSANEYELARNSSCFDVNEGRYVEFADYEEYRSFIIRSRQKKEKRIEKQSEWFEKKRRKEEKALAKREAKYRPFIEAVEKKAKDEGRELTWSEKHKISDYERKIKYND